MIAKRRAPDGKVYERVTAPDESGILTPLKRLVHPGDLCWCQSASPQIATEETPPHTCLPWKLSDEQDWTPPESASQSFTISIDDLIRRVLPPSDSLLESEDLARINTLALLYQAKALERLAVSLELARPECRKQTGVGTSLGPLLCRLPLGHAGPHSPETIQQSESRSVCSMCNYGEHAQCDTVRFRAEYAVGKWCECPVCHQAPDIQALHFDPHLFEGLEDNHFCTKCGGGRLHRIHQQ